MREVDVRGMSCPIPVMRTEVAIVDEEAEIRVLCDSGTAKANVTNQLEDAGYSVTVSDVDDGWALSAVKA